tara:strand:- start:453 stop:2501 length:2049 start_codon:yes stop_codon:yes gene_type:complete
MNKEHIKGIKDKPLSGRNEDKLGITSSAKALTEFIDTCQTPMTIGIQGSWGTGKTSILNMMKERMEDKNPSYEHVWVNAWEHSLLSKPEETLFKIVNNIILDIVPNDKEIKKTTAKILGQVVRLGAAFVGGGAAKDVIDDVMDTGDGNQIKILKSQLEDIINAKKNVEKIIIYIDDLDRINPPDAVAILELLKNIFDIEKCVFVLAIDYDVVVKGLRSKYNEQTAENEWEYRAFFDKIIQLPFQMPVGDYDIGKYVSSLMHDIDYLNQDDLDADDLIQIKIVVENSIQGNPRSLKRLINSLSLIEILDNIKNPTSDSNEVSEDADDQGFGIEDEKLLLFILVCIQIAYPDIYEILAKDPIFTDWNEDTAFKYTQLKELGKNEEDNKQFNKEFEEAKKRIVKIQTGEDEEIEASLFNDDWEHALYRICYANVSLKPKVESISKLLNFLNKDYLSGENAEKAKEVYQKIFTKAAVTSVTSSDTRKDDTKTGAPTYLNGLDDYLKYHEKEKTLNKDYDDVSLNLLKALDKGLNDLLSVDPNLKPIYTPSGCLTLNYRQLKNAKFCQIRGGKTDKQEIKNGFTDKQEFFINIFLLKHNTQYRNTHKKTGIHPFQSPHGEEFYGIRITNEDEMYKVLKSGLIEDSMGHRKACQDKKSKLIKNRKLSKPELKKIFYNDLKEYHKNRSK